MALELEIFYSPDFVTWGESAHPTPTRTIELAQRPDRSGPSVLIGRSMTQLEQHEEHPRRDRVLVAVPESTGSHLSVITASIRWIGNQGIEIRSLGRNPVQYRCWGWERSMPATSAECDPYSKPPIGSRVVVKLPSYGLWLRTIPSANFPTRGASDDSCETPSEVSLSAEISKVLDLFYCPHADRDAAHTIFTEPTHCPDDRHAARRKNLAVLLARRAPSWVWPPQGWYLPDEDDKNDAWPRFKKLSSMARRPTAPWDELVKEITDVRMRDLDQDDLCRMLVETGVIRPTDIEEIMRRLDATEYAVDWSKPGRGAPSVEALAADISARIEVIVRAGRA